MQLQATGSNWARPQRLLVLLLVCLSPLVASGEEGAGRPTTGEDAFDRVARFLRDHVDGRTVVRPGRLTKIANDSLLSRAHVTYRYHDLLIGRDVLEFRHTWAIEQKLWDLDAAGQRVPGTERDEARVGARRIELRRGAVPGDVRGVAILEVPRGGTSSVRATPIDGGVRVRFDTVGYIELFAKGGGVRPGAVRTTADFTVEEGKLVLRTHAVGFDVNPDTLERTKSDEIPGSEYRELEKSSETRSGGLAKNSIAATITAHEQAWNKRDVDAIVRGLAADVDHVDSKGVVVSGRASVAGRYRTALAECEKQCLTLSSTTRSVRLLGADVALVLLDVRLTKKDAPDKPGHYVTSVTLQRDGSAWKIAAIRTTAKARP